MGASGRSRACRSGMNDGRPPPGCGAPRPRRPRKGAAGGCRSAAGRGSQAGERPKDRSGAPADGPQQSQRRPVRPVGGRCPGRAPARAPASRHRRRPRAASRTAPPPSGPTGRDEDHQPPGPDGPTRQPRGRPSANRAWRQPRHPPAHGPGSPSGLGVARAVQERRARGDGHPGGQLRRDSGRKRCPAAPGTIRSGGSAAGHRHQTLARDGHPATHPNDSRPHP